METAKPKAKLAIAMVWIVAEKPPDFLKLRRLAMKNDKFNKVGSLMVSGARYYQIKHK